MQTTEHLNLNLPEATDPYDIGNENENMEILDSAIYNHGIILGTTSAAGHVKTINDLTKTSLTNGEALSARMGNALGQMMAPIVTGPNYPSGITKKGDQFVYNGRLCVVTANTVSTSTAINIGSSGNANYASPITSQISDLGTSINATISSFYQKKFVTGLPPAAAGDVGVDIVSNGIAWGFALNLPILANNNLSSTLPFEGKYYVRLQRYNVSELKNIFPIAETAEIGDVVQNLFVLVLNHSDGTIINPRTALVKETTSLVTLVSDIWSSDTSRSISIDKSYTIFLRMQGMLFKF